MTLLVFRKPSLVAILSLLIALPTRSIAQQKPADQRRQVPGCRAALCADESALVTALDTLLRHESPCADATPFVLRTLHVAPFTHVGDAVMGRTPTRLGLPTSPAVLRMEDFGGNPFRRYWSAIRIVDSVAVRRGDVPANACLFVFSPVTWLGEDLVRVIVVESRERPAHIAQRFVFLAREAERWRVIRIETGMQS